MSLFDGWGFNLRWHPKLGTKHLRANITEHGYQSTSSKWGWLTWNFKHKRLTIDTPGPGSWSKTFGGRARQNRTRR